MRNPTAITGKSCGTDIQTKANAAMAKAKETPSAAIPLLTVGLRRPDRAKSTTANKGANVATPKPIPTASIGYPSAAGHSHGMRVPQVPNLHIHAV